MSIRYRCLLFVLGLAGLALSTRLRAAPTGPPPRPPVEVYAALDGRWTGTFVGYDPNGRELYRIAVEQTYRTVDGTTQTVTLADRQPDGQVIRGQGRNVAVRKADGSLELRCIVDKSNGEHVEHVGRVVRAADGQEAIVWSSQKPGRSETFLETVRGQGAAATYHIQGVGRYGDSLVLMSGTYRRMR